LQAINNDVIICTDIEKIPLLSPGRVTLTNKRASTHCLEETFEMEF